MTRAVVVKVLPCTARLPKRYKVSIKGLPDILYREPLGWHKDTNVPVEVAVARLRELDLIPRTGSGYGYVSHGVLPSGDIVVVIKEGV